MKRFKNILFVYSGNADANLMALKQALDVASINGGRLTVLTVLKQLPEDWHYKVPLERYLREQVEADVKKASEESPERSHEVAPAIELTSGEVFIETIGKVLANNHDLVIKAVESSKDNKRLRGFLTTDMHLLRKCPCPLWLFREPKNAQAPHLLAAIDPSDSGSNEAAMTKLILQLGSSLRERLESASLDVIHCWELEYEDAMRHSPFMRVSDDEIQTRLNAAEAKHRAAFAAAVDDFRDGESTTVSLLKGNPTEVIPNKVRDDSVDLIVMGTVARTGIKGLFIGNTAETILTEVDCSVLAVKPEGFVTPVAPAMPSSIAFASASAQRVATSPVYLSVTSRFSLA